MRAVWAHLRLTERVDDAEKAAQTALSAAVEMCTTGGLTRYWRELIQDVYATNLSRHEPDELGDTPMTLGTNCVENIKSRALRRSSHDDLELPEDHWHVDGLEVCTPRNVLTFVLPRTRIIVMKVPYGEGRTPQWDRLGDWEHDSHVRQALAEANSQTLRYRTHLPADVPLFPHGATPGVVRDFMFVWAGEPLDPRTAGWLTVPAEGQNPFIAREQLWWDDEPPARLSAPTKPTRGPSFDERQGAVPQLTIRPRPAAEEEA